MTEIGRPSGAPSPLDLDFVPRLIHRSILSTPFLNARTEIMAENFPIRIHMSAGTAGIIQKQELEQKR